MNGDDDGGDDDDDNDDDNDDDDDDDDDEWWWVTMSDEKCAIVSELNINYSMSPRDWECAQRKKVNVKCPNPVSTQ